MNKKRILLVLPAALLPYLALSAVAVVLFSADIPLFQAIMEKVFGGNGLYLAVSMLVLGLLAAVLSVVCFFVSTRRGWDALSLAKTAMIVKLIQIPAYLLIFVLGLLLVITIFTIPFAIGLLLFNCLTLFLTGLLTAAAVVNAVRRNFFTYRETVWVLILQLIFCADVAAAIIFYFSLKKRIKASAPPA